MLTLEIKNYIERSVLCWLATADVFGVPNVSPKEVFLPYGEKHLLIANIASPESVKNIQSNPNVCVSFVDVFVQKGYKLRGTALIVQKTDVKFTELVAPLEAITKGVFPIHSVIAVSITEAQPIVAPSYRLFEHTTEENQIKNAMIAYGVRPIQ